ncbi:MAG: pentapeptide repeat-containing protein [Rhodospirillaceae bacterium]|nr:pentapeptide repeat-containing protein [Rhodospirillaceae bacterium]
MTTVTPITTYTVTGINESYALRNYNGLGIGSTGNAPSGNARNLIVDQVTLSAAAQQIISTGTSSFAARSTGLTAVNNGAVVFDGKDISGAAFVGQNLDGVSFNNSVLRDVNFTGASLRGATFTSSVVDGARFNAADLTGANLSGAQGLQFSQIQGAFLDETTQLPLAIGNLIFGTFGARGGTPFLY